MAQTIEQPANTDDRPKSTSEQPASMDRSQDNNASHGGDSPTWPNLTSEHHRHTSRQWLITLAIISIVMLIAHFARSIAIPIVGAALLSMTLSPLVRWFIRRRIPRRLIALLFAVVVSAVMMAGILAVGSVLGDWVQEAPVMIEKLERRFDSIRAPLDEISKATSRLGTKEDTPPAADTKAPVAPPTPQPPTAASPTPAFTPADNNFALELLGDVLGQSVNVLAGFLICIVLTLFLLLSGDVFLAKLLSLFPTLKDKKHAMAIVREIETDISQFLGIWTLINFGVGIVVWGSFTALGVPDAWLWGVVATLFNYVPYAGPWVNGALALVMGLVTFDQLGRALMPAGVILIVNAIEAFIISPMLHGRRLSLNTVAVLLATVIGAWLWGVAGALMAVPLLVAFYVIASHVPAMKTIALLLNDSAPGLRRDRDYTKGDAASHATPPLSEAGDG